MREWVEEIVDYMEEKEEALPPVSDLSEEIHQVALETELLLQASADFESAFSSIVGKHATARRASDSD
jgi:hypothetical protein